MSELDNFSNNEWLSRTLRVTKLSPFGIFLLLLGINLVTTISLAMYFGAWNPSQFSKGLSSEPSALLNDNLAIPMIFAFFQWMQYSIEKVYKKIIEEGIISKNDRVNLVLNKNKRRLQSRWLSILGTLIGVIFTILFLFLYTQEPNQPNSSWVFVNPIIVWVRAPMIFIAAYALFIIVCDLGIMVSTLNSIFSDQTIKVEPLHPDGAGGLSPIGTFSSALGYLIFVLGLAYSVRIMNQNVIDFSSAEDFAVFFVLVMYILVAPTVFFLPLRTVRTAMVRSRDNLLKELSRDFDIVFSEMRNLRTQEAEKIEPFLKRYRQIEETRKIVEKFPVWPFNIENLRNFFGLVVFPILPALISIIIDLLK